MSDLHEAAEAAERAEADVEHIACPTCGGVGKLAAGTTYAALCPPCKGSGTRGVVRVGLDVVMVPNVRLRACKCGQIVESPDAEMIKAARQGKEMPPVECLTCGRVIIAQRNLVLM